MAFVDPRPSPEAGWCARFTWKQRCLMFLGAIWSYDLKSTRYDDGLQTGVWKGHMKLVPALLRHSKTSSKNPLQHRKVLICDWKYSGKLYNSFFGDILQRWHHSPYFCWKERHEELGECVGYRIGGDSVVGKRLNFQTTGWLLRLGFLECWIWWRGGF